MISSSFMLWDESHFPSVLRPNNILLYVGTTFCLSIRFLMKTVASNFALLWITLSWIGVYSVWDLTFISLRYIPRSGISGPYANSMINLRNRQQLHRFISPLATHEDSNYSISSLMLGIVSLLNLTILGCLYCYFFVILICICIVTYSESFHALKENTTITPNASNMKKLDHSYIAGGNITWYSSVQISSVAQSGLTLCNPMDCSTAGFSVHHRLPEPAQTHLHWVGNAIQPSHPLLSPSPPTFTLSQHQGLF